MNNLMSTSIINPYDTTIGKQLFKQQVVNKLETLVVGFTGALGKKELSYGIELKNHTPVILTGVMKAEQDIPFFQYPIIFYGARGESYIAIDLREYVSSNKLKTYIKGDDLFDLFTRYDGVNFLLCLMGVMDICKDGNLDWIPKDVVIEAYAYLYQFLIKGIVLLPFADNVDIQYLTILYFFTMFKGTRADEIGQDKLRAYMEKMGRRWQFNKNTHDILISGFIQEQLNITDNDYCTLEKYLKLTATFLTDDKKKLFQSSVFGNTVKNIWMGHGRQTSALMCFENISVFISMLYSSNTYVTLKDSKLTKIMKESKIDLKRLNQVIESTFKFIRK